MLWEFIAPIVMFLLFSVVIVWLRSKHQHTLLMRHNEWETSQSLLNQAKSALDQAQSTLSQTQEDLSQSEAKRQKLAEEKAAIMGALQAKEEAQKSNEATLSGKLKLLLAEVSEAQQASHETRLSAMRKRDQEDLKKQRDAIEASLDRLRTEQNKIHTERTKSEASILSGMKHMRDESLKIASEAKLLTQALTQNAKTRGNWGEMQLENLLTVAGFKKDIDYQRELSVGNLRMDFVLKLPSNRQLIIDAKCNLINYQKFIEASEAQRDEEAHKHWNQYLQDIRHTVDGLAKKNYPDALANAHPDVFMFIPIEGAFLSLVDSPGDLLHDAYAKHIVPIGRSAFYTLVRLVADLRRQAHQEINFQNVQKEVQKIYDKAINAQASFMMIEEHLDKASEAFEEAKGRFYDGKGNLMRLSTNLVKQGFAKRKKIAGTAGKKIDDLEAAYAFENKEPPTPELERGAESELDDQEKI